MLQIDGAHGEGGGQVLRTALVLSLLTNQPFRIDNIRRGRSQSGLKAQHLHIIKALQQMSDSQVKGAELGALTLTFTPGQLRGGDYQIDIGTAGAIPLVLQSMIPAALFADGSVHWSFVGGTDVRFAMTIDFWQQVLLPYLLPYAKELSLTVARHGYYPKGGGKVKLSVSAPFTQTNWQTLAQEYPALAPERSDVQPQVSLISRATAHLRKRRVAERQANAFIRAAPFPIHQRHIECDEAHSVGSSLTAWAKYESGQLGVNALGERGVSAEQIGHNAFKRLYEEIQAGFTVDLHTADNLMLWIALFGGEVHFRELTGHIETNAWVIEQFLPGVLSLTADRVYSDR